MISSKRHTETDPKSGKNLYIIETYLRDPETRKITNIKNDQYTGVRFKVPFHKGVGRTTSRLKAQFFSEMLEYVVVLHKEEEPWVEVGVEEKFEIDIFDEDSSYVVDNEDDFGDWEE